VSVSVSIQYLHIKLATISTYFHTFSTYPVHSHQTSYYCYILSYFRYLSRTFTSNKLLLLHTFILSVLIPYIHIKQATIATYFHTFGTYLFLFYSYKCLLFIYLLFFCNFNSKPRLQRTILLSLLNLGAPLQHHLQTSIHRFVNLWLIICYLMSHGRPRPNLNLPLSLGKRYP
jgi:hypothetical protein